MNEFLDICLNSPSLIPTGLLFLVCIYWLFVIMGAFDIELFDLDIDGDVDVDADLDTVTSAGFVVLRFLNIGQVPLMIWVSCFALAFWMSSVLFAMYYDDPALLEGYWPGTLNLLRNVSIGVVVAKLITQPMRKWFDIKELKPADLVGKECEISSEVAVDSVGQARFRTDAAPLLLNVRSTEGALAKGSIAVIVEYNPDSKTYLVERATREV